MYIEILYVTRKGKKILKYEQYPSYQDVFQVTFPSGRKIVPALIVIDMQNGFVSKGGSYDKLGMITSNYREIIPKLKDLIEFCRSMEIPIFYTEAVREPSGIDLLTKIHNFLPKSRQERLKISITVRGTWDADITDELKPNDNDLVVIKRRDSAFQDTELRVWLQSEGINLLVFTGADTSICVETSLRDGFNIGYDVALISDATASGNSEHYKTTLERVKDYYGLVMNMERFKKVIQNLDRIRKGQIDLQSVPEESVKSILDEFDLLDPRTFALSS